MKCVRHDYGVLMRDRVQPPPSQRHDLFVPAALDDLLARVAQGDDHAFEQFYRQLSGPVYGLLQRVLRDPAQSEEVAQEVFLELWRTSTRYNADLGSVRSWAMMIAHRRAVDRVRTAQASTERDTKAAQFDAVRDYDEVTEAVIGKLEHQHVRKPHRRTARIGETRLLPGLHLSGGLPSP